MAILKYVWLPLTIMAVLWLILISLILGNASNQTNWLRSYTGEHVSPVWVVHVYL